MVLASLLFALMGVCVRFASPAPTRRARSSSTGAVGALLIASLSRRRGRTLRSRRCRRSTLAQPHWRHRAVPVVPLDSIGELPLATAVTLN